MKCINPVFVIFHHFSVPNLSVILLVFLNPIGSRFDVRGFFTSLANSKRLYCGRSRNEEEK